MVKDREAAARAVVQAFYRVYETLGYGFLEADLLVDECLIVEIKAVEALAVEHEAPLLNYLKATDIELGLLLNFGPRPEIKRRIFESARKRPPQP